MAKSKRKPDAFRRAVNTIQRAYAKEYPALELKVWCCPLDLSDLPPGETFPAFKIVARNKEAGEARS